MSALYRTHHCGQLRAADAGQVVSLAGWVASRRDHGGVIFIDLRDRAGLTQVVFRPEEAAAVAQQAHALRSEDVISVRGRVAKRLVGTENTRLATGEIELVADALTILNKADTPPFPLDAEAANEDLRLAHRYLDLRRPRMARNLQTRHRVVKTVRDYLDDHGFLEIETPILSKSTPEGARDFLVPSRLQPGSWYALPQAPQQYKQLLMVGGLDKYFQIAKCFRDEDLRADRQPEFTQIDIEASFVERDDILQLVEGMLAAVFKAARGVEVPLPFPRLTYDEAMNRYGSDKPDTRFGLELVDLSDVFALSQFKVFAGALSSGGVVKAINAKGFAGVTTGQIEELTKMAQSYGAKGLAFIKVENGEWKSPIVKFFSAQEKAALTEKLGIAEGDLLLFGADKRETVCEVLGRIRLRVAEILKLVTDPARLDFLWVTDFPLLAFNAEENKWDAVHHPFTRPLAEDVELLKQGELGKVRAAAYDVVLNGFEIGGGSIRIHEPELQAQMFSVLGISAEQQAKQFGHILKAFSFGAPPHGGIALGVDRIVMLICGETSIRDVMAFPKNNRGQDLMSQSPSEVEPKQLRELALQSTVRQAPAAAAAAPPRPAATAAPAAP
ncbi:MAG: aspartate--tRNA ligase [Verrucomicrobia bacterium]|nr:aspartate--tRNA ligase [Verrucomicrobiota bacterium]